MQLINIGNCISHFQAGAIQVAMHSTPVHASSHEKVCKARQTACTPFVCCQVQASWLPKEYRSGSVFRAAARYKGAPFKLQQQLAHGSGADNVMYLSRCMGVGSSMSNMQWEVSNMPYPPSCMSVALTCTFSTLHLLLYTLACLDVHCLTKVVCLNFELCVRQ